MLALQPQSVMVGSVWFGAEDTVVPMVRSRLGMQRDFGPCTALGVVRRGVLLGGVVYHNYQAQARSIEVSLAFDSAAWALPETLRTLFGYPFLQLDCVRMEAMIARRNKRARKFIRGLGFTEEGCHRRKYDGTDDAMSYGMLRDECRWIRKDVNGQNYT